MFKCVKEEAYEVRFVIRHSIEDRVPFLFLNLMSIAKFLRAELQQNT